MYAQYVFHIPQGGNRSAREGAIFKKMGVQPGVSDYLVMFAAGGYPGLWIEVKTDTGTVSESQKKFITGAREQGFAAVTAFGLDETWEVFNLYIDEKLRTDSIYLNTITKSERKRWRKHYE